MKMTKRILVPLFLAMFLLFAALPVFADSSSSADKERFIDSYGLLSESEANALESYLDRKSSELQFDIVVLVIGSIRDIDGYYSEYYGGDYQALADDWFDYKGYGMGSDYSGALLLYDVQADYRYLSTCGEGIKAVQVDGLKDAILSYFYRSDYKGAFTAFADYCEECVLDARSFHPGRKALISVGVGIVVAFIATGSMKSKLTSVKQQTQAANYVRDNSLEITESRDTYLYNHVSRTERSTSKSGGSHTSSSGRSHGGGGF